MEVVLIALTIKKCNQCFAVIDETFFGYDFDVNFCPNCGADMEGEENERI